MELELIIAAVAAVLLLIIILIIFTVRKRISIKGDKSPEPAAIQAAEHKPVDKLILNTEPKKEALPESQASEPLRSTEPGNESSAIESQANKMATLSPKDSYDNLPQDSTLRRHYLTHLRAMIESLKSPRPTDSALSRHYDSIISAEIEQCLSDQGAIERLIHNYEDHKKTTAKHILETKTTVEPPVKAEVSREDSVAEPEHPKLPEDSMLRRHAITQLYALVESNMPLRPTDSVLRRHYDTIIKTEVNKLLGGKVV